MGILALDRETPPGIEFSIGEHDIAGVHVPATILPERFNVGVISKDLRSVVFDFILSSFPRYILVGGSQ